jgi:AraC family transcriptional regulator, arabinose operon regulatory protein
MLTVFLAGRGIYRNSAGQVRIEANMVGLVGPADRGILMAESADPYTHYYCRFNGAYAVDLAERIVAARGSRFFHVSNAGEIADLVRRMASIFRTVLPEQMDLPEVLLAQALVLLQREEKKVLPSLSVAAVEEYLRDHLAEPHDLEKMAEHFYLSKAGLCRVVKKLCGKTVVEMSEAMKIDWARILLETGTLNVTEVGRRVGYADAFYFSRVFKKHTGTSPKIWTKKREPGKDMATRSV